MMQAVGTETSRVTLPRARWRKFGPHVPAQDEIVEIRRLNDDKTILRARSEMPPSFDWHRAEWRPL